MKSQYYNAVEQANHLKTMRALAEELHANFDVVKERYEGVFDRLQVGATVRDFLPVLTARYVREALRRDL